MTTLSQASHQWATRPADQRFTSLITLHDYVSKVKGNSTAKVISSRQIQCEPYKLATHDEPGQPGFDHQRHSVSGSACRSGTRGRQDHAIRFEVDSLTNRAPQIGGFLNMLTQKPRVGQRLNYGDGRDVFTVFSIDGNILHVQRADGSLTQIIWRFHDGLNTLLTPGGGK